MLAPDFSGIFITYSPKEFRRKTESPQAHSALYGMCSWRLRGCEPQGKKPSHPVGPLTQAPRHYAALLFDNPSSVKQRLPRLPRPHKPLKQHKVRRLVNRSNSSPVGWLPSVQSNRHKARLLPPRHNKLCTKGRPVAAGEPVHQ